MEETVDEIFSNGHDVKSQFLLVPSVATKRKSYVAIDNEALSRNDVIATARSPSGRRFPVEIVLQESGQLAIDFTPEESGEYKIEVTNRGRIVEGSPFSCFVLERRNKVRVSQLKERVKLGQAVKFEVDRRRAGDGTLTVTVNEGEVPCSMQKEKDGIRKCTFTPKRPGLHSVRIVHNGSTVNETIRTVEVYDAGGMMMGTWKSGGSGGNGSTLARSDTKSSKALPTSSDNPLKTEVKSTNGNSYLTVDMDKRRSSTNTIESRTSATSLIDSTKVEEILKYLHKGSELTKVKSKSATYRRCFFIHKGIQLKCEGTDRKNSKKNKATYISDVRDVLDKPNSDAFVKLFRANPDFADRSCCFSVVIGDKRKTLDLIAPDVATKSLWVTGLRHLKMTMEGTAGEPSERMRLYLKEMFKKADKNDDETLNFKEVVKLMQLLNLPVGLEEAKRLFQEADSADRTKDLSGEDCLNEEEFIKLYFLLTKRDEIDQIFRRYARNGNILTPDELTKFFYDQGHELTEEQCSQYIRENEPNLGRFTAAMLTSAGFNTLMNSAVMDIKRMRCRTVFQDMDQPLSHYFIDSSHNTYLSSNQLVGDSSVECYIRALKMGCRCVELDVWDGENGEPIIYHGHTLTSKILLRDVLEACNTYAFETSQYPVILSVENHCSLDQQRVMAKYFREILQDNLLTTPLADDVTNLPSPNQLLRKFIIKTIKLPASVRKDSDGEVESEGSDGENEQNKEKPRHKHKLAQELSECVVICMSAPFKGFDAPFNKESFKCINSLSEGKASSLADTKGNALVKYTARHLCRIYPSGTRASSSNYDPVPGWVAGCQVVALNYQTTGVEMYVNRGMFEDNGRSGYILKPSFMRDPSTDYDCAKRFYPEWRRTLNLTIISGFQLPKKRGDKAKSILDPFVVVDILGLKVDRQTDKTKTIENNGFNPNWNHKMTFNVTCPHLALVLFRVYDSEDTSRDVVVAQYCLPFRCLQQGYRTVHLKSKHHEPLLMSSLFVNVEILQDTSEVEDGRSSKRSSKGSSQRSDKDPGSPSESFNSKSRTSSSSVSGVNTKNTERTAV